MIAEVKLIRPTILLKSLIRYIFRLIYLVMLLGSLAIFFKPGASIFYKKIQIPIESLSVVENAFQYTLKINKKIFNLNTLLVLENQRVLGLSSPDIVKSGEHGTFTFSEMSGNSVAVLFVPSSPTSGAEQEHVYYVGIRPFFVTRAWGLFGLCLLGAGLALYAVLPRLFPQQWNQLSSALSQQVLRVVKRDGGLVVSLKKHYLLRKSLLKLSASSFVLSAFFYVFMEWIFFVTKPSFIDVLGLMEKFEIFFLSGLALSLLSLVILVAIFIGDWIVAPVFPAFHKFAIPFPVALIFASLCLILIDNFTYTVFEFGIATTTGGMRVLYILVFIGGLIAIFREYLNWMSRNHKERIINRFLTIAVCLAASSLVLAGFRFKPVGNSILPTAQNANKESLPNIVLLSSDGLNAANMSVYGYERDTTPFLTELAKTSLVGRNHFSNAGSSLGSETALLTGKLPFTTRVLYSPDTLKGTDMYQHLPGLLRMSGYRTVSIGVPFYVDVNIINFKNGFDVVNCQENASGARVDLLSGYGYDNEIYFLTTLGARIRDRLRHIFFIEDMENPFQLITQDEVNYISDLKRLNCFYSYLDEAKITGTPLFTHIHLMGTHGSKFSPTSSVFSEGKSQDEDWMVDFYDDAILDFDMVVRETVERLTQNDQLENTILVIYTDHSQRYVDTNRTPLIIRFPSGQYQGEIIANTQTIDIAPTILDYLGFDQPAWMEGKSLLGELDSDRLILVAHHIKSAPTSGNRLWAIPAESVKPPFYQFGKVTAIQCQKYFQYNLTNMKKSEGEVSDYVNPCPPTDLVSADEVWETVGQYLIEQGFDLPADW